MVCFRGLLSSVQHCGDWVSSTDKQEPIQKCFRSLEYIFKFIIQSRLLFSRATGGQYEDSFKKDLYNVFIALNKMLGMSSDIILPTQVHCIDRVYGFWDIIFSQQCKVFWDIVLCCWVSSSLHVEGGHCLQNIGNYSSSDTALHRRRLWSSDCGLYYYLEDVMQIYFEMLFRTSHVCLPYYKLSHIFLHHSVTSYRLFLYS